MLDIILIFNWGKGKAKELEFRKIHKMATKTALCIWDHPQHYFHRISHAYFYSITSNIFFVSLMLATEVYRHVPKSYTLFAEL